MWLIAAKQSVQSYRAFQLFTRTRIEDAPAFLDKFANRYKHSSISIRKMNLWADDSQGPCVNSPCNINM